MKVPLEKYESIVLASRLDEYKYIFSAIRNESDTKSFFKGRQRKLSGVRPGIQDFFIKLKKGSICMIELKRQRPVLKNGRLGKSPSKVSIEQYVWQAEIAMVDNCYAKICYGAKEAIEYIIECEAGA